MANMVVYQLGKLLIYGNTTSLVADGVAISFRDLNIPLMWNMLESYLQSGMVKSRAIIDPAPFINITTIILSSPLSFHSLDLLWQLGVLQKYKRARIAGVTS